MAVDATLGTGTGGNSTAASTNFGGTETTLGHRRLAIGFDPMNAVGKSKYYGYTYPLGYTSSLMKFDLSCIPAGATITSAALYLDFTTWYATPSVYAVNMRLYRVTSSWTEYGVTFNTKPTWTSVSTDVMPTSGAAKNYFNLASVVQGWTNGTYPNYGVRLEKDDVAADTLIWFGSREYGINVPELVVTYTGGAPTTDNLEVTVRNALGALQGGALCQLYNPSWQYLGGTYPDQTTNASGVCGWANLPAANYRVQVYYSGPSPFPGGEYWGYSQEETVSAGGTRPVSFQRMLPYATQVELRLGSASGAVLDPSSKVAPGQTVWVGVTVTQSSGGSQSARVRAVIDASQGTPWDWDGAYLTPNPGDVANGGTRVYTGTMTVSAAVPLGAYYRALLVESWQGGAWVKTDGWQWYGAFTVEDPKPGAFSLSNPADQAALPATTKTVDLAWTPSARANYYEVYFGTSPVPPKIDEVTAASKTVDVESGQTYYWWINAVNSSGTKSTSVRSFSVIAGAPGSFTLSLPVDLASLPATSTSVYLEWQPSANATSYDVYFGTTNPPPKVNTVAGTNDSQPVTDGQTYYWTVVATNSVTTTPTSSGIRSIHIQQGVPPGPFTLAEPHNRAVFAGTTTSVTLSWNESQGATSYEVYFGESPSFGDPTSVAGTSTTVPVVEGKIYFWTTKARNEFGDTSTSSGTRSFIIPRTGPARTVFIGILGGSFLDDCQLPPERYDYDPREQFAAYDGTNMTDVEQVAWGAGGIEAIGLRVATLEPDSVTHIFSPGRAAEIAQFLVDTYRAGDHVVIVGHSVGAGDAQDIAWSLESVPIALLGLIDSIEICNLVDADIPSNVSRAMGYYQNEGPFPTQGENAFFAVSPSDTIVTNVDIDAPVGPATDLNKAHRNMDNDRRVWEPIVNYVFGLAPRRSISLGADLTFGSVTVNTTAARTLTISNSGNMALTVTGITYPAGFSGAWAGAVAPGRSQDVLVTFMPTAATNYVGTVTVDADQTSGTNTIGASGIGVPVTTRVLGLSGSLAFGSVTVNTSETRTLTICNTGDSPLTVSGITYPSGFSGTWSGIVAAGSCVTVSVTFAPTAVTSYGGPVTVNSDKTSGTNTVTASGTGTAAPTRVIQLSGNLAFGNVTVTTTATGTLTIRNTGNNPLTVSGITYPSGFSGAWSGTVPAGGSQAVSVTFAPTAVTSYGGPVTVNSDKTSGTDTVTASGTGTAAPTRVIQLSGNLAFGNVTVTTTATGTLTIRNTGNSPLTVSGITYPSGFSGAWNGDVSAGGWQDVTVTFAPTEVTSYGGTVTVNGNQTSGTSTIHASGTGRRSKSADLNGDGMSDVLWRHATGGDLWLWPMDGAARPAESYVRTISDTNWEIRAIADFDGDGKSDLFWRNKTNGQLYFWPMDGDAPLDEVYAGTVDPAYDIVGTGDFNGDGKSDILWRHTTLGDVWVWPMDGATRLNQVYVDRVDPGYVVKGLGDLDGDLKADIVWHGAAGDVWVWPMNGTTRLDQVWVGTVPDTGYQIQGVADVGGDGKADLVWWHATLGEVWIWTMNGPVRQAEDWVATVPDTTYQITGTGDYDGDGKADLLWQNGVNGEVWVWLMNGPVRLSESWVATVPDLGYRIVR